MTHTIGLLRHACTQLMQKKYGVPLVLVGLLIVAASLRINGFDWDNGLGFHPDERSIYMRSYCMFLDLMGGSLPQYCGIPLIGPELSIGQYFDPDISPLNPHWFPLGTILIYILVLSQFFIPVVDVMDLRYVGRTLTIAAELFSILIYYRLSYKMFGFKAALISATLIAFSVSHIQHSLFYRPEPFMVLFSGIVLLACWNRWVESAWKTSVLIGLALGLSVAFKVSGVLLIIPVVVLFVGMWGRDNNFLLNQKLLKYILEGIGIGLIATITFITVSPFTILDFEQFYSDITIQSMMASSAGMFPFTTQYFGTPSILYNTRQLFYWGLGIPLGISSLILIGRGIWNLYVGRNISFQYIFLLSWVLPFFFFIDSYEVRFLRYLYPIIPILFVLNGKFISEIPSVFRHYFHSRMNKTLNTGGRLGFLIVGIILISHSVYGVGFAQIYNSDHPAIQASKWIQESIPINTNLIIESHWDEQIPALHNYNTWLFPAYEEDTIDKTYTLATYLESSEYIMFYSNRPYVGITADQSRYPYASAYYRALFEQDLGYELEKVFQEYPSVAGFHVKDTSHIKTGLNVPDKLRSYYDAKAGISVGYADENVVNYDHPLVLIFKNKEHKSVEEIINTILTYESTSLYPYETLLLESENKVVVNSNIDNSEFSDFNGILRWIVILGLMSVLGTPVILIACKFLPDRGYGLVKIFGLFFIGYLLWILVSIGLLSNTALGCWVVIILFALFNITLMCKYFSEIKGYLVENWKYVCSVEIVFMLSFLGFLILRMSNPDLWHPYRGGEKPMELAYFNAVLRSVSFPPYDPWLSGSVMNYYYWGYVPLSILTKLTNLPTTIAFNLSVVTLFSVTCTLLFSLGANLYLGLTKIQIGNSNTRLIKIAGCGLLAIIAVTIFGNTDGAVQIWEMIANRVPIDTWFYVFDYWRSSRIIPMLPQIPNTAAVFWITEGSGSSQQFSPHITEFPFFTFLFADLHAHMISIPFSLMTLIFGVNVYLSRCSGKRVFLALLLFALACGSLFAINAWDYPTYCGLGFMLLIGRLLIRKVTKSTLRETGVLVAMYMLIGYVAFWLFHLEFNSAEASLVTSLWSTPVMDYMQIKLFPVLAISSLLSVCVIKDWGVVRQLGQLKINYYLLIIFSVCTVVAIYLSLIGWSLAGILIMALAGLCYCARSLTSDAKVDINQEWLMLPIILMAYSLLMDLGVEFIRYDDDIGRMNTLFKFYLQSWIISGVASVGIILILVKITLRLNTFIIRPLLISLLAIPVLLFMIYPVFSIYPRVHDRFVNTEMTLDGFKYAETAMHVERDQVFGLNSDKEMIDWLNRSISGVPIVLEGHGDQYRWNGRVSSYTGFPTVLGWPWHQTQQKPYLHAEILNRARDVDKIYQSDSLETQVKLIKKYKIDLIVWGELESIYYNKESLRYLEKLEDSGFISNIYSLERNRIYQVKDY